MKEIRQSDAYQLKRRLDLGKPSLVNHRVPSRPKHKCLVPPLDLKCPEVMSRIAFIAIVTSPSFERKRFPR